MANAQFNNGDKRTIKLEITNIPRSLNKNQKVSIGVVPTNDYNYAVLQLTSSHIDNLAEQSGLIDWGTACSAIGQEDEGSILVLTQLYGVAGEPVIGRNGEPIEGKTYTKTGWKTLDHNLLASEDALDYVSKITIQVDVLRLQEKQKKADTAAKAARNARKLARITGEMPVVGEDDPTIVGDDDPVVDPTIVGGDDTEEDPIGG